VDLLMRIIVIPKINAMMGQRYPMEVVMDAMKVICVHNVEVSCGQWWRSLKHERSYDKLSIFECTQVVKKNPAYWPSTPATGYVRLHNFFKKEASKMDEEAIDNAICEIMHHDGPDRHVDGHEVITDFIMALLNGRGKEWEEKYAQDHGGRRYT